MNLRNYLMIGCFGSLVICIGLIQSNECVDTSSNGYCRDKVISVTGDLNIAVPISIHDHRDERFCDDVSISGFQSAVAVEWIFNILNGNNSGSYFIPGVKLGYTIYDDCGLSSRTASFLTKIFHRSTLNNLEECTTTSYNATPYAGVIAISSPSSSSKAMMISLPDVPVISVNHYDDMYDRLPGAFFGQNSTVVEIKVILEFMRKNNWNFIGVVYTQDTTGQQYMTELLIQSTGSGNCYLHLVLNADNVDTVVDELIKEQYNYAENETFAVLFLGLEKNAVVFLEKIKEAQQKFITESKLLIMLPSAVGKGIEIQESVKQLSNDIFLISPLPILFNDFKKYFESTLENMGYHEPWISEYIKRVCSIQKIDVCQPEQVVASFAQESHIDNTVVALLSMADSLKRMHMFYCGGNVGLCDEFIEHLSEVSLFLNKSSFTSETYPSLSTILRSNELIVGFVNSNVLTLGNDVYNIQHFKLNNESTIAEYSNGYLQMNQRPYSVPESICKVDKNSKCSRCIENEEFRFGYTPGDVYILGLFSIHQDGSSPNNDDEVFRCGDFRTGTTAIITVSAFLESVKSVRSKLGINFGAIALDDCYNELNISAVITELFTRQRILYEPDTGKTIDFSKVVSVVGALSSRVTLRIADVMSSLHIPMVSYGASAKSLDDRIRYPYFLRTVPSDALQIEGMVKVISNLNFKYVGALYIDDAYGTSGIQGLITRANSKGICVSEPKSITEDSTEQYIKDILREKYMKQVEVIAMFSIDSVVENILGSSVLGDGTDNVLSNYAPIFIASEAWGTNLGLANKESAGSLIFTTDSSNQVSGSFTTYLQSLSPSNITENPWIYRFWEDHFHCYMPRSFERRYTSRCIMGQNLSSDVVDSLSSDQRNVHTEIAVNAIGFAYKRYLSTCTSGTCFQKTKDDASQWTRAIQDVYIPILDGTNFKPFKTDNNGNLGFTIHNIQKQAGSYSYVKVGTYNGTLSLQKNNLKFYDSIGREKTLTPNECPTTERCRDICIVTTSYVETSTSAVVAITEVSSNTLIIVMGALAGLLFLIVLLLIVIVLRALRAKDTSKDKIHTGFSMEHLAVPNHHRSNRSLNDIYHEPHSVHSSLNDIRPTHVNKGFQSDTDSGKQPPISVSSGIVPGSSSGSGQSVVMYSDMSQMTVKPASDNKHLSPESSDGSNNSLKSLTRRVLQPPKSRNIQTNDSTTNANLTYLSSADLVIVDEEESTTEKEKQLEMENQEKLETIQPSPAVLTPNDNRNVFPPAAYPVNGHVQGMKRPLTLPGINPVLLSPHVNSFNSGFQIPSSELNLYTNDMYLIPIADSLPTYEQHVLQQQQLQKDRILQHEKQTHLSPTSYNGVHFIPSHLKQNGAIQTAITSPNQGLTRYNGSNPMSPSSSVGSSQSPSVVLLSPAQNQAILSGTLVQNPHYYHQSPHQFIHSPQSNSTMSPNEKDYGIPGVSQNNTDNLVLNGVIEMDDREEVMI